MTTPAGRQDSNRRNRMVAAVCAVFVAGMVGMAYAAVPLYTLFCQVTGFGGTTQVAEVNDGRVLDRQMTIRFDANTARDLAWSFAPVERSIVVRVGETSLAFYRAENTSSQPATGTASFNVTPLAAGAYFNKIDCFCFTEQTLAPGAGADMPVSFFVDPAINDDPDLEHVDTITLSYTFFPLEDGDGETEETASVEQTGDANLN